MQVKICPKCGTENKDQNACCANCYASLDGVASTLSSKPDEPVVVKKKAEEPVQPSAYEAPPPPSQHRPTPYSNFERERLTPLPRRSPVGSIIKFLVIAALLGGGGYAGWQYFAKPESPKECVRQFLNAFQQGDYNAIRPRLTSASIQLIKTQYGSEDAAASKLKEAASQVGSANPMANLTVYDGVSEGPDKSWVEVEPGTGRSPLGLKPGLVLLREEGRWKIDFPATEAQMITNIANVLKQKLGPGFDAQKFASKMKAMKGLPGLPGM